MVRTATWLLIALAGLATPCPGAAQTPEDDVRAAVAGIYAAVNAGDAEAAAGFVAAGGYTEITPSGRRTTIDAAFIRRRFGGNFRANFQVAELEVRVWDDVALATGYRVGGVVTDGSPPPKARLALSMLWIREGATWKLAHVHLTPAPSGG